MAIAAGGPWAFGVGSVSRRLQLQTTAHTAVGALGLGRGGGRRRWLAGSSSLM